jgi:hypothetical protein
MRDSYESPADHRPWQARSLDWAASSQRQGHPDLPAVAPGGAADRLPGLADRGLVRNPMQGLELSSAAPPGPVSWPAQDTYPDHSHGHATPRGPMEHHPAGWLAYDPYQRHPAPPGQPPYPAGPGPSWRHGWSDYDPYAGYPIWPGHPAHAARNAGLHRLSKLTWRAAEVSAVIAVGFVALFARTAHGATSPVAAQRSVKPSIHAAPAHPVAKRHHHHRRHHHRAGSPAPALAPPAAAPAAAPPPPPPPPAAPAPAPPPPPVTTSGGSGGG